MKTTVDVDELVFHPSGLGCVLYLPGIPGGDSKILDRSAYGNHGAITGATWKRLPGGLWCPYFDGIDDYITVPYNPSLDITVAITLEVWLRVISFSDVASGHGHELIYREGRCYTLALNWSNDRKPGIFINNNFLRAASAISAGQWYHLAGTYNGASKKIYINGKLSSSDVQTGSINTAATGLIIQAGTGIPGGSDASSCMMALHRVYNWALSALEIQNHFNREKHLFGVW